MSLDISSLVRACDRLAEGLERYQRDISDTQIRDGLIQRFEFTYEISHKILKRYLESIAANPGEYDEIAFADLIRTGNEHRLLRGNWSDWRDYRSMRGRTSHTYDEAVALQVVECIPAFLQEVQVLLQRLQERIKQ